MEIYLIALGLSGKCCETLELVKEFARRTDINATLIYSYAIDHENSTYRCIMQDAILDRNKPRQS